MWPLRFIDEVENRRLISTWIAIKKMHKLWQNVEIFIRSKQLLNQINNKLIQIIFKYKYIVINLLKLKNDLYAFPVHLIHGNRMWARIKNNFEINS